MSTQTAADVTGTRSPASTPLLAAHGLYANYGAVEALHGVDFSVDHGETVVVLGANGAGKTTMLRAICQLVRTRGELLIDGEDVNGRSPTSVIRRGIATVPQGRGTLTDLSVDDNLRAGAYLRRDRANVGADIERWYETFPRLRQRMKMSAGSLSGGEQQMLAIARALMSKPRLLLLDEPSLGLAPVIVQQLFGVLEEIQSGGDLSIVVVEQNAALALDLASRAYVLEAGQIAVTGSAAELRDDESVRRAYLGY